ncbi:MAG: WYL domain-containing protein [Acidimicrobiales bacterium]
MTLIDRNDELVRLLRLRADWRTVDLAAELDVSTRTVLRDLDRLRDRGFDISAMSGPGGGVHLEPTSVLVTSQLAGDEVVALILSVAIAQAMPWMPFASGAQAALAKIEASLPYERARQLQTLMMRIMIGNPSPASVRSERRVGPLLARLFETAFTEERLLAFSYRGRDGKESQRVVEPHGLLVRAPIWYVIAWDTAVDEPRLFRADRIRSPHVLAQQFVPRPHELLKDLCPNARPAAASTC